MSDSEYMRNVKWSTALYCIGSVCSILIAMCGMYYGLKGDIKDNRITSHEELTAAVVSINRKQDSIQHVNDMKFNDIWVVLKNPAMVTERRVDGKLLLIPVK